MAKQQPSRVLELTRLDGRPYTLRAVTVMTITPRQSGHGTRLSMSHFLPDDERVVEVQEDHDAVREALGWGRQETSRPAAAKNGVAPKRPVPTR